MAGLLTAYGTRFLDLGRQVLIWGIILEEVAEEFIPMVINRAIALGALALGTLLAGLQAPAVLAQSAPKPIAPIPRAAPVSISPRKAQLIQELLQITNSEQMAMQSIDQMLQALKSTSPQIPDAVLTQFRAELKSSDLNALITPIYDRNFSETDLQQMIAFYKSPLGQRMLEKMPAVMQESITVGQQWGLSAMQRALEKVK